MTTHPICAYACLEIITAENSCNLQTKCLCQSPSYVASYHNCINQYCDAADIKTWLELATDSCSAVGVKFSTEAVQTATRASVPLPTSVIFTKSVAVAGPGFTANTQPVTETKSAASASTAGALPASSNSPEPVQKTQTHNDGISAGAIAGIVVGAIAVVLIAFLAIILIRRQRRKKSREAPPEATAAHGVESQGRKPSEIEEEAKPLTATSAVFVPELPAEQATYVARYEKRPIVSEGQADSRFRSYPLSPTAPTAHGLSPSSAYTEMATVALSDTAASTVTPSDCGSPQYGIAEADSTRPSRSVSPNVHELGNTSYGFQHELETSPAMVSSPSIPAQSAFTPQGFSSSPARGLGAALAAPHTSFAPVGRPVTGDEEAEDPELERMKAEIEAVRVEKERVRQLQALEERERELSRKIVDRELSRGT